MVEMSDGNRVNVKKQYRECRPEIKGIIFLIDLKPTTALKFDVIGVMDWLPSNNAHIICDQKLVTIRRERRCGKMPMISMAN